MEESLLSGHVSDARVAVAEEEEELLWNELKDHHEAPRHERMPPHPMHPMHHPHAYDPHYPQGINTMDPHAASNASTVNPLPALRAHVHLPAISTLFHDVIDSAKTAFTGFQQRHGRPNDDNDGNAQRNHRSTNTPDEHGHVANLDAFLINLYNYYYHKGFWCIVVVEIVGLITGLFSVTLSSFLLGCVQWRKLIDCHRSGGHKNQTIDGCDQELEHYLTCSADSNPGLYHLVVAFYFMMFLVYWASRALHVVTTLRDANHMAAFYRNRLHIDERQVQTVKWDEVVTRVLDLIGSKVPINVKQLSSYRLQIDPTILSTPHDFARRIMRRENYLIACMNHSLFQGTDSTSLTSNWQFIPTFWKLASTAEVLFSRNMECNLNICLVDQMFDAQLNLSQAFLGDIKMVQKRFVIAGVLNFVLTPFILLYRVFHFFFLSAQEWHLNRVHYFGTRRWSSYASWKFREYNELPHVLEARMARSYPLAEKYLSLFPAGPTAVIAGGLSFCLSSFMAVLIAVSLVEESILLEKTLYGRQLIWYLTIATAAFALVRSFASSSPSVSPFMSGGDCEEAMMQLASETHYFPPDWRGRCHSFEVRDAFLGLFPYKAVLFLQECLSVIMAPYILCFVLPQRTREILLFLRSHTLTIPHVGAVCRFAEFDFKTYAQDHKMESSFVSFKQNHPTWVGAQEGEQLMQRLGRLKEEEMEKSMRLGDTMAFYGVGSPHRSMAMSMSQQLMQSQAIHTALGGGIFPPMPHDSEFYWLEKLHQQGLHAPFEDTELEETKQDKPHS